MPHAEIVAKYVQNSQYKETLARCKTRPISAPAASAGPQLECWAANVASDLQQYPEAIRKLVLDGAALDAALARCQALSMEQRFKSAECMAAGRANTFIELRQPRAVETLKPLTAQDFKATPQKNTSAAAGVRDHLILKPLTPEDFKGLHGASRQ
ncbi:hypothetical protein ASC93_03820 [Massilia sp. Root335]|jgi:hypothetical protein|nr:hypothetical protein ASC93_03820 [Massilia sp. Root335]